MLFGLAGHLRFVIRSMQQIPAMKCFLPILVFLTLISGTQAQPPALSKKYQSLLWEISGKGQKKPSYLIGTMHVSNKLAFNLPDSFYHAIRSAQVVALETNPETWQEDMDKYEITSESNAGRLAGTYVSVPSDYLSINTLKFYKYNKKIERALYSSPSAINNLLYRSYGSESSDFEEDTYLDMYIYQCGKKWGKKVAGVEDYGQSMRLMGEAYRDAAKEKNRKERSYSDWDEAYSTDKLQEAYRRGNLDLLDTINKYNSFSAAFDEKFLYQRNEIQAAGIDSIIRSGAVLFVGVGAAHLPGDRGVIEILRRKGYRLRPVKMGERASREKELLEKIRVPVTFRTDSAADGFFRADIPGKFYQFGDDPALSQLQCADMANGSYYMVTRIMTNAWLWDQGPDEVYRVVDSLLYENIPGKILTRTPVTRNGYQGIDVLNRTRRGDLQRYQIYITPFEVIVFKVSGNGDYVRNGPEAGRFFSSIQLKEYRSGYRSFTPAFGGFIVTMPHEPYTGNDGSWMYDALDRQAGIQYRVIRTDIHNYQFAGEDSFDLALMEESFMASDFIDTQLYRHPTRIAGYPALEGRYRDKSGALLYTRFIIQGPHYFTLIARSRQENPAIEGFFRSFDFRPLQYGAEELRTDTSLYFSVKTPWYPESRKIRLNIPQYGYYGSDEEEEEWPESELLESGLYRNKVISNDSTGEKIFVSFFRSSRYHFIRDSAAFDKELKSSFFTDSTYHYRVRKSSTWPDGTRVWESVITDTASSRTLWSKLFYKNGNGFSIATQGDTLSVPSPFVQQFFSSFQPSASLKGTDPFTRKSGLFFADFYSSDSLVRNRALMHIKDIDLDSADLPRLQQAVASLNWNEKKYLEIKKELIGRFSSIRTPEAAVYLRRLYYALDDTVQLQYAVLESLLQQKTKAAYQQFREIINAEPPVLDFTDTDYSSYFSSDLVSRVLEGARLKNGKFMDELKDSLPLAKDILPDLLPLLNLEDYKADMLKLLGHLSDSSLLQTSDYEAYFSKFLLEAKQLIRKQSITEKRKAIVKAEESKKDKKKPSYLDDSDADNGNEDLFTYAKLLIPFMDQKPAVEPVIRQMLQSADKRVRYSTFILLLRKNRPVPDTLLQYFAGTDDFRYELYNDLAALDKVSLFPSAYRNHSDLGRSALLASRDYAKPDTLVLLQSLPAGLNGKKGLVYFYKYKSRKDDLTWKLAAVGMLPEDSSKIEFSFVKPGDRSLTIPGLHLGEDEGTDFTGFLDSRLRDNEPLLPRLKKELKKMLYSKRNSAREFYKEEDSDTDEESF